MPIKTFRGKLDDEAQERIRLETLDGKKGYRIKKFQLMPIDPMSNNQESVVKIYSIQQTAVDGLINFSDITLLASGYIESDSSGATPTFSEAAIVFDRVTFNQDIFITHKEQGTDACNYYLELEQISLDDVEATAVILKNFRNTNTV